MINNYSEFTQDFDVHKSRNVGPETTQQFNRVSEDAKIADVTTIIHSNKLKTDRVYNEENICAKLSSSNYEEEQSPLQDRWMKFDTFLQKFYRTILDGKKPPDEFDLYVNIVKELVSNDPHQLFARLEVNLQEFVIEIKLRQLELLDCVHTDEGPRLFVFCLIEGYNKLMFAAYTLSPLLLHLEVEHLARFNLSWCGLNQHLFHTWVFIDPKIQQVLPLCISKLGKSNCDLPDFNKRLIRQFLSFDDEMTKVGGKWREAESAIIKYHQENSMQNAKWRMTKVNWDLIRKQTRIFHEELKSSGIPTCIDLDVTNGCNPEVGNAGDGAENIQENGKKLSQTNMLGNKTSTNSLKRCNEDSDTPQNQLVCECCQTGTTDYLSCASLLDPELLLDMKSLKNCTHASYNLGCKDTDILGHLNPDGKKMYSHLHKFKIQQMSNGTRIKRSTSLSIALRDILTTEGEPGIEVMSSDLPKSSPSADSQRLSTRQQMILQQRQHHQKKLMQVMQWYEQQDFQHRVEKQLQEHHLLLQQQRKIDELHAHLLLDQEVQETDNLQVQQSLQKVEEKFQQLQYTDQHEDKQSITNSASCGRLKEAVLGPKTNRQCSENSISGGGSSSPVNVTSSSSASTSSVITTTPTTTAANSSNANVKSTSAPVTRKNSTTQTASSIVNGHSVITCDKRAQQHPLPDVVKSAAAYVCPKHGNDADHSYCSDISSEDDFDWDTPDSPQRHCDCCYCEVFGSTPVSRNFQETRERLRLILTKKKAKSVANNEKSAQRNGSNGSACANVSQSASQGANKTKKEAMNKKSNTSAEYKGDKSIEEILDFIEGNKNTNMKRAAKKMRRRQRQLEEEERRRKEEEAEKLRQEELRRKEKEEKHRLEEEKRKQELLRKQGRKKGKQGKQSKQQSFGTKKSANHPHFSNKINKNEKNASSGANDNTGKKNAQKQSINKNFGNSTNQSQQQKSCEIMAQNTKKHKDQIQQSKQTEKQKNVKRMNDPRQLATTSSNNGFHKKNATKTQNKARKNDESDEKSVEPQMVTIKRVMQPNGNEPTVTITLRGATPKEDKVLYTLHNGQMCQVKEDMQKKQNVTVTDTRTSSAKGSVKLTLVPPNNVPPYSFGNHLIHPPLPPSSVPLRQMTTTFTRNVDVSINGINSITERIERLKLGPQPVPIETSNKKVASMTAPQAELTTSTAIQINQAVNQLSARPSFPNNFDLENIKLPPGITITKVDPSTMQRKPIQVKQQPPRPSPPAPVPQGQLRQAMMPPVVCPSNVIFVDTGDENDEKIANGKKKRRRRRKDRSELNEGMRNMITNSSYHSTTNGLLPRFNPIGSGLYRNSFMNAAIGFGGALQQQQPAIIQMNGSMVTIRNPALHQSSFMAQPESEQLEKVTMRNPSMNGIMCSPPEEVANVDVDEYERELEAFKQFCSQSVPAESKAKVNLNIEDIVLKKKGPSVIGCS